jgi:hypothetical protein
MEQHRNKNHRGRPRGYGALYFYYLAAPAYVPEPYVPPAQLFPQYLIYSTFEKMGNWRTCRSTETDPRRNRWQAVLYCGTMANWRYGSCFYGVDYVFLRESQRP